MAHIQVHLANEDGRQETSLVLMFGGHSFKQLFLFYKRRCCTGMKRNRALSQPEGVICSLESKPSKAQDDTSRGGWLKTSVHHIHP